MKTQVNNIRWDQQPLVRILIPLVAGIGFASFFEVEHHHVAIWSSVSISWSLLFLRRKMLNYVWANGVLVAFIYVLLGVLLNINVRANTLYAFYETPYMFKVRALGIPTPTAKGYKFEAQITQYVKERQSLSLDEKVVVYINDKTKNNLHLNIDSDYWLHAEIKRPGGCDYPGAFDYQSYLKNKGVYGIVYAQPTDLFEIKNEQRRWLSYITSWRNKLLSILNSFCVDINVRAIAGALLFGARSEMSDELKLAYSTAGLVHVLAVSGMHVSMVCSLLLWFFDRFGRSKNKTLYCLPFVWLYALLTGMSASVTRAAVMISFIILGKRFFNVKNSTNLLAATAFSLLIYNPLYFYDLGAQLSFAAVWGIQFLGRSSSLRASKGLKSQIFELLRVCVVAQAATLPITLYHFGNFPVYFLLANLIAVPLSSLVIYVGVAAYFVFTLLPEVNALFDLMALGIQMLNTYSLFISKLPIAQLNDLALNSRLLIILTSMLFFLTLKSLPLVLKMKLGLTVAIIASLCSFVNLHRFDDPIGYLIISGRESIVGFKTEAQLVEIKTDTIIKQRDKTFAAYNRFKKLHWEGLTSTVKIVDGSTNRLFTFSKESNDEKTFFKLAILPNPERVDFEKVLNRSPDYSFIICTDSLRKWEIANLSDKIHAKTGRPPKCYRTNARGLFWLQK